MHLIEILAKGIIAFGLSVSLVIGIIVIADIVTNIIMLRICNRDDERLEDYKKSRAFRMTFRDMEIIAEAIDSLDNRVKALEDTYDR